MTTRGKKLVAFLLVILFLGGISIYGLFFSNWFLVNKISITGQARVSEGEILQLAQIELNTPLVELESETVVSRILEIDSIKAVEVRKGWPNSVVIAIEERRPIALTDLSDGRYLVDETGKAFSRAGPDDVYLFVYAPNDAARGLAARVSQVLPDWLIPEVRLVESFNGLSATVVLNSERRIIWGDEFKSNEKSAVLKVLLRTPEGDVDVSTPEIPVLKVPTEGLN
jgi:cell division protein FtsQ